LYIIVTACEKEGQNPTKNKAEFALKCKKLNFDN